MGVSCGGCLRDSWNRASDRCSRFFPCLSDPARRSTISLKVALVVLHLVSVGVLFLFYHDLIQKTRQEPWYTVAYVTLFVATLVQYFVTSGTSPGYVLDALKAIDETDALARRSLEASKQPASSKNGSVVITVDGKNKSRGNTTAWTKLVMDLYPQGSPISNLTCLYCNVVQKLGLGDCINRLADILSLHEQNIVMIVTSVFFSLIITVFGLGHALAWETTVPFWWYVCEETALCLWTCILHITYLKSNISKTWWAVIIIILLLVALSICLVFLLLLLLFHSYLVITNQTTYELVRRRRIVYLRGIPQRVYPFNQGICRNLYLFCCARSSMYRMEALPTAEELDAKLRPYTWTDVLSCRCC